MAKLERIWPRSVQTLGAMREAGIHVKAICSTCGHAFKVDLDTMITLHGRSFSLINKRGRCRLESCDGSCVFVYRTQAGGPFRPLRG